MTYKVKVAKDRIKFSAAHFTVFGPDSAERLHGHNYYLSLEVEAYHLNPLGFATDIRQLKNMAYTLSQKLDEYILLPQDNPYIQIRKENSHITCQWNSKTYVFPQEDVQFLEVNNITCENLAFWFWTQMQPQMGKNIKRLAVTVKETLGQESTFESEVGNTL